MSPPAYHLVRRARPPAAVPELDDAQRRVVDHEGGPLLVLAGPGTGKTATIVEAVVDRVGRRGLAPDDVLVLTFSRRAAVELRTRIVARLRRTTSAPMAFTFHGYAYALLRREHALAGEPPPRLLSGPEQLVEVRRLLEGEVEDGAAHWPERLRPALSTRGFAEELRDLLLRARERGLDGSMLAALGRLRDRDDWVAAGGFLRRYLARFAVDPVPSYDYAELIQAAATLFERDDVRRREQAARSVVFVDEYQDTDPAQEHLLHMLGGDGRELVVVGDPDQSIYGFRGAETRGILEFPYRFRTSDGREAPVVALQTCRRSGATLLEATRRVARRLPAVPGAGRHRELVAVPGAPPGEAEVCVAGGTSQEAALVADVLRRAHLVDGVPWSRMAVLVRSAVRQLPVLRRALAAADVPVTVAGDEVPLAAEPAVRAFAMLLRCALRREALTEEAAEELLTGPVSGADALAARRLRLALKEIEERAGGRRPTGELLVEALRDPRELVLVARALRDPAERVARLLAAARERVEAGATVEEVLWEIWARSGLGERWMAHSLAGGSRGAASDRDLDAIVALFDAAARFTDQLPRAGVELFLDDLGAQEIPADTLAERAPAGDAVRLLTAHRAKGLEWDLVVVAGVEEGRWPDLRQRGSLLGVDELVEATSGGVAGPAGPVSVASKLLDEERRLFYVAATRARRRLVVTAVGGDDAEERPSRLIAELLPGYDQEERLAGRSYRWLALPALVADLRAAVTDPSRPAALRRAAAAHLAALARARVRGADPGEWFSLREVSDDLPLFAADSPITVSPSQVELFRTCPLRWLLETAVGARRTDTTVHLGSVIHALAAFSGQSGTTGAVELARRLDEVWSTLDVGSPWFSRREHDRAVTMVERFAAWSADDPRALAAVEESFEALTGRVRIRGRVDRLERDRDGRAVVVDLKTGSSRPADDEIGRHPQLGAYQLAIALGAFAPLGLDEPGGAELVQIGKAAFQRGARIQHQPALADDADPEWAETLVREVGDGMSAAAFLAAAGDHCRSCPVRACCPAHDEGAQVAP